MAHFDPAWLAGIAALITSLAKLLGAFRRRYKPDDRSDESQPKLYPGADRKTE
ncbi:hypothetical protein [Sphingomonas sp. YL-JM2C]